jgi:hypothetical protein
MQRVHKAPISSQASSFEARAQPVEKIQILKYSPSHCIIREMKNNNKTKKKTSFLLIFQ